MNDIVPFKEIPCTVCGDASSGLHFGAITCEGCKVTINNKIDSKQSSLFVYKRVFSEEMSKKDINLCVPVMEVVKLATNRVMHVDHVATTNA